MTDPALDKLSPREKQALYLAGSGMSNKEVAEAMQLTTGTVKGYLHRAYNKVGLDGGREQLASLPPESLK